MVCASIAPESFPQGCSADVPTKSKHDHLLLRRVRLRATDERGVVVAIVPPAERQSGIGKFVVEVREGGAFERLRCRLGDFDVEAEGGSVAGNSPEVAAPGAGEGKARHHGPLRGGPCPLGEGHHVDDHPPHLPAEGCREKGGGEGRQRVTRAAGGSAE